MDFESDETDLLQIVDFFESLFTVLVERVPERRAQFRRVLNFDILPRLQNLRSSLQSIKTDKDEKWKQLSEHDLDAESLRLKFDEMEDAAHKGLLRKTFGLSKVVLGSLSDVFSFLKAVKEFKEVLEEKLSVRRSPYRRSRRSSVRVRFQVRRPPINFLPHRRPSEGIGFRNNLLGPGTLMDWHDNSRSVQASDAIPQRGLPHLQHVLVSRSCASRQIPQGTIKGRF